VTSLTHAFVQALAALFDEFEPGAERRRRGNIRRALRQYGL
jgi:hypothetical protein